MMWKKITIEGKDYVVKIDDNKHNFNIILSDFIQIWFEKVKIEEIIERCKKENPMFEADDATFNSHVLSLVKSDNPDIVRSVSESEEMLILKLQTTLEGIKFKFTFMLHKGTPEFFYDNITRPLLTLVQELQTREITLCALLAKKDIEINEYKMNGAQITRKTVETQKFSKLAFKEERLGSLQKLNEDPATYNPHDVFASCTADLYSERSVVCSSNSNNAAIPKEEIRSAGTKINSFPIKKKHSLSKRKFISEEDSSVNEVSVPLDTVKTEPEPEEEVKIKKRKPAFKGLKL